MKGAKPMAVLADKNGVTYVVKVGQVLFDRTVTAISSNGVTLKDHSGAETIAIP